MKFNKEYGVHGNLTIDNILITTLSDGSFVLTLG